MMLKLAVAVRNHRDREGVDVEIRDEGQDTGFGGGWIDAREPVEALEKLLDEMVAYLHTDAVDMDERQTLSDYQRARADMAESLLRRIAASEVMF